jgi:hypothetical protein
LLREELAADCLVLGITDLDAAVLQGSAPRTLSQRASRMRSEEASMGFTIDRSMATTFKIGRCSNRLSCLRHAASQFSEAIRIWRGLAIHGLRFTA